MIACLYGRSCAFLVEPVVDDLQQAAAAAGQEMAPVTIEQAVRSRARGEEVSRLYVLPFEIPLRLPADLPTTETALVRALFPQAEVANSLAAHELCWDKLATARRLLARGVPMPDSLVTDDPEEVRGFVREHGQVVIKETRGCAGLGHLVGFLDQSGELAGETRGRRYLLELEPGAAGRRLDHGVLSVPPPYYVQRLVAAVDRDGVLTPAQVLRAYIVDGRVVFWTERYRERYRRPSDFIISHALGARYRFLQEASEEAQKIALRAADVLGVRFGVVDLVRTGSEGPYVLEADTDGPHMFIDRQFKHIPEFRDTYDFDRFIAEAITAPVAPPRVGGLSVASSRREGPQPDRRGKRRAGSEDRRRGAPRMTKR